MKLIHERIGGGRLFTVGIGADPNAYFMHAAAAAGRGSYTFIGNRAQVQERMGDLFLQARAAGPGESRRALAGGCGSGAGSAAARGCLCG